MDWLTHGSAELDYRKQGSLKIAFAVIALLFISDIATERLFGFQFHSSYDKIFNIFPYIMRSFGLFSVWVIGQVAVSVFLDGSGTMRTTAIYSAYALVPYVAQRLINVLLSHILIRDEMIFMQMLQLTGTVWSAVLLLSAVRAAHRYSLGTALASVLLTVLAMAIMLFLLVLSLSLLQQMWLFVQAVYLEISYRVRN